MFSESKIVQNDVRWTNEYQSLEIKLSHCLIVNKLRSYQFCFTFGKHRQQNIERNAAHCQFLLALFNA